MNQQHPNISTHVPVKVDLPPEKTGEDALQVGRPDLPVPSLWQVGTRVTHRVTGQVAVVRRVDHGMMMFRAHYPDVLNEDGTIGRDAPRTEWQHCHEWLPEVQLSPEELARQAALQAYRVELEKLDAEQLALASVLCDDIDPAKSLAKLRMMIRSGLVKTSGASEATVVQAVGEVKGAKR